MSEWEVLKTLYNSNEDFDDDFDPSTQAIAHVVTNGRKIYLLNAAGGIVEVTP